MRRTGHIPRWSPLGSLGNVRRFTRRIVEWSDIAGNVHLGEMLMTTRVLPIQDGSVVMIFVEDTGDPKQAPSASGWKWSLLVKGKKNGPQLTAEIY
jgi:hypothetical protein